MGVSLHEGSDFCQHCFLEPKAAIITRNTSQMIRWWHADIYSFCYFSFSDTRDHVLRMQHFQNYAKWHLSLPSTRDLLSKQRQLMQRCVQRFTLLEVIVDEETVNENCFLSLELKRRRPLIEIIRRLKYVPPRKSFSQLNIPLLDSGYI